MGGLVNGRLEERDRVGSEGKSIYNEQSLWYGSYQTGKMG